MQYRPLNLTETERKALAELLTHVIRIEKYDPEYEDLDGPPYIMTNVVGVVVLKDLLEKLNRRAPKLPGGEDNG